MEPNTNEATAPKRLKTGGKKPIIIIGVIVAVLLAAYVGLAHVCRFPERKDYPWREQAPDDAVVAQRCEALGRIVRGDNCIMVASARALLRCVPPVESRYWESTTFAVGEEIPFDEVPQRLVGMGYTNAGAADAPGLFRVHGDTVEVFPAQEKAPVRIEFFGDEIDRISTLHPLTGDEIDEENEVHIFPASHYVAGPERMERALKTIREELDERLAELRKQGKELEAQRLNMRTTYDLEMLTQVGVCSGVENYSRHFDGRAAGTPPHTLLDFFPDDFLLVIDESHVTVPQIGAMYEGDASRKRTLVEHGFRLPSAMDNRPLKWPEFLQRVGQTVYLSATPGDYEMGLSDGVVEQIIRPTGLLDPKIDVRPVKGQIDDLLAEIKAVKAACKGRLLKVIIECCFLTDEEKIKMCEIVTASGAEYIKTSTGFGTGGATREDVALFAKHVGPDVKIKAAGGIADLKDAEDFINLGASRLGTSRIVKAVKAMEEK